MNKEPSFHQYTEVNPVDGSQRNPNRLEIIEKRNEYIDKAITSVLDEYKSELLVYPGLIVPRVEENLQKSSAFDSLTEEEKANFSKEFSRTVIGERIFLFFGEQKFIDDEIVLQRALSDYYSTK